MNEEAEEGEGILPKASRRRIWIILGAIMLSLLVVTGALLVTEAEKTQAETLVPSGAGTGGEGYGVVNSSFQFTTQAPGLLSGSWQETQTAGLPGATAMLFLESQCTATNYSYPGPTCYGEPIWQGPSGGGPRTLNPLGYVEYFSGEFNVSVADGPYTLVFVGQNETGGIPFVLIVTPISLTPTPWWWL